MRRVGNENLLARIAFGLVISAHQQDSGELALRARGRLQGDRVHAGDLEQAVAQRLHDAQSALRNLLRLIGMRVGDAFQARDKFVDARVVLHGAGAQRIHAEIDGVIPRREPREVADDFDLAHFGHIAQIFALLLAQQLRRVDFGHIERRQLPSRLAGRRLFENQSFVLAEVTRRFASHVLRRHRATSSGSASFMLQH